MYRYISVTQMRHATLCTKDVKMSIKYHTNTNMHTHTHKHTDAQVYTDAYSKEVTSFGSRFQ